MAVYSIDEIITRVTPVFQQYHIGKAYLFGSYARGDATEDSDIDLVVEPLERIPWCMGGLFYDLEETLGKTVDILTIDQLEESRNDPFYKRFAQEIDLDRKEIYDGNV